MEGEGKTLVPVLPMWGENECRTTTKAAAKVSGPWCDCRRRPGAADLFLEYLWQESEQIDRIMQSMPRGWCGEVVGE